MPWKSKEQRNAYQRAYRLARGMQPRQPREKRPCRVCGKPIRQQNRAYCSWTCWERGRYAGWIARWLAGEIDPPTTRGQPHPYIRRWWTETFGERCSLCGWAERNPITGKVPLEWDHINGDCSDNRRENLRLLCPNCHALSETHARLNYGKSKRRRKWAGVVIVQRGPPAEGQQPPSATPPS
jgi:hypothetical protein